MNTTKYSMSTQERIKIEKAYLLIASKIRYCPNLSLSEKLRLNFLLRKILKLEIVNTNAP